MNREQLEQAIADGIFPKPFRVLTNGPRGPLLWQARTIKTYIEGIEAERAAKLAAEAIPEGYSTTADLVKLLGVSRQTIHNYYGRKIPRPQRFGGKPAWSPAQLHQILVAMGEEE
jgi:predicted DNA-binding transcriptional regulator AlpA